MTSLLAYDDFKTQSELLGGNPLLFSSVLLERAKGLNGQSVRASILLTVIRPSQEN